MIRIKNLLAWARSYKDMIAAEPVQDRPESTPQKLVIKDFEDLAEPQNPEHRDMMRQLDFIIFEMANCQSSRLGNGLLPFDSERYNVYEQKFLLLISHIEATSPIDAPEFTPSFDNTGSGRVGI